MNKKILYYVIILLFFSKGFAQEENGIFKDKLEYLLYSDKNFDINSDEIFYAVNESGQENYQMKFSLLMFYKNDRVATIEEVEEVLGMACPPKKLVKKVDIAAIETVLSKSEDVTIPHFKNMKDGTIFNLPKDEIVAVFIYSYKLGNVGQSYIQYRKKIQDSLGIKTIIVSIDGAYISDLDDISKTEIIKKN